MSQQQAAPAHAGQGSRGWLGSLLHREADKLTEQMGGPARRRAILLLGAVLALTSADQGAVGGVAPQLEGSLHINNTEIGLLVTLSTLVAAVATLPIGVLTDRVNRTHLLVISVVTWGVAEVASGFSTSYLMLLLARVALGALTATAAPAIASLIGDLFEPGERGRIYGFILTGELVGAGFGLVVAGDVGGALGWQAAFFVLAVPSLFLAVVLQRCLAEPARGGKSRLRPGAQAMIPAEQAEPAEQGDQGYQGYQGYQGEQEERGKAHSVAPAEQCDDAVLKEVRGQGVEPIGALILHSDPAAMGLWAAVRYVLRIRTNVFLIISSALGYFFLAGLQTFAVVFLRGHYGLSQFEATAFVGVGGLGAIAGTLMAGRLADRLVRRGIIDARLTVGAVAFLAAAVFFVPAILSTVALVALPFYVLAGAGLAAPNPAVDSARLDIMPSRLWGRAEAVRTALRTVLQSFAPLLFGLVSQVLGGGGHAGLATGVNAAHSAVSTHGTRGLVYAFLIMLVPLAASGLMLLRARRTYPGDVATAAASDTETRKLAEYRTAPQPPGAQEK